MPNWVQNIIHLEGNRNDIRKVLSLVKSDKSDFDFNLILPMPEELNISSSSINDKAIVCYASHKACIPFDKVKEKYLAYVTNMFNPYYAEDLYKGLKKMDDKEELERLYELGKQCCNNIDKYGHVTWYSWRCDTWGTKWPADGVYIDDNTIEFQTAWSCPVGILERFAEICAECDVTFEGEYADEDRGYNTGEFNSETGITPNEDASYEAIETYNRCWGEMDYEDEEII